MRVAFVVQRYGAEVCGGAEAYARRLAEHMARHWELEVWTTCATDHLTWRNDYVAGETVVENVRVRRFPVDVPRDPVRFAALTRRVFGAGHEEAEELAWVDAQGPRSTALVEHVRTQGAAVDLFVFFTYLFWPTFFGLRAAPRPSILVPTAHDEPPIHLAVYRDLFRRPAGFAFNSVEERDFVNRCFGTEDVPQDVIGLGVDEPAGVDPARFLARHPELADADLVVACGRIEPAKGCWSLFNHFLRLRAELPDRALKLVLVGASAVEVPSHPDVIPVGFVDERDKQDALAAARVVVLPSPYESLSLVALEAWGVGTPVLANGACDVLRGQCRRSQGGLWYESYAEFREALTLLLDVDELRARLGRAGRAYVRRMYAWDVVEAKHLALARRVLEGRPVRAVRGSDPS
jgi:glycosyltransferase involved in cell wall biosynthesis